MHKHLSLLVVLACSGCLTVNGKPLTSLLSGSRNNTASSPPPAAAPAEQPAPAPKKPPAELVAWTQTEPGSVILSWTRDNAWPSAERATALLAQREALTAFAASCQARGFLDTWPSLNGKQLCDLAANVEARVLELAKNEVQRRKGIAIGDATNDLKGGQQTLGQVLSGWLDEPVHAATGGLEPWLKLAGETTENFNKEVVAGLESPRKDAAKRIAEGPPAPAGNDAVALKPAFTKVLKDLSDQKIYPGTPGKIVALSSAHDEIIVRSNVGLVTGKTVFSWVVVKDPRVPYCLVFHGWRYFDNVNGAFQKQPTEVNVEKWVRGARCP